MEESIASHVTRCLGLFSDAVDASETSVLCPSTSFNRSVRDEQTRFKVWSGNIGAHRTGMSSLDHRLRDSSNIRNQVVNLLLDLYGLLEDAIAIITGEEPPWDQISSDGGVFLDQDDDDSGFPDTEFEQISMDVADVVNCLLRLSVAIRNPAPHDRFVESHATDTSHYEPFDIEHVYSKFKSIDPGLAERLGKAISRRRQFFKYRETHRMKLSHDLDYHYLGDAETIASSLPEHLKDKIIAGQISPLPVIEDNYSDAGVSQTSYATSAADTEQRRVPPLPIEASKGPFECPFCFMIIAVTDRLSWKKHVYGDLRPYVCLYKDCMTPEKEFSRRHQWMDHVKQNHWKVYPCPFSCHLTFPSNSECTRHVSESHAGAGTPQELAAMISLCEQPLDMRSGISCPICGVNLSSHRQYQSHVGRHQEQLALFALPNLEPNNESDPYDDETSDAESIENKYVPIEEPPSQSPAREILDDVKIHNYNRRNEYFIPRDGIDRQVITADICYYLGSEARVQPGHYEDPQTGQVAQGFFIRADRNLTSAMIQELKATSATWDSERRAPERPVYNPDYSRSNTYKLLQRQRNDSNEAYSRVGSDGTPFSPPKFSQDDQYSPEHESAGGYSPGSVYDDDGPEVPPTRTESFVRDHGDKVASSRSSQTRQEELKKKKKKKEMARTAIEEFDAAYGSASYQSWRGRAGDVAKDVP